MSEDPYHTEFVPCNLDKLFCLFFFYQGGGGEGPDFIWKVPLLMPFIKPPFGSIHVSYKHILTNNRFGKCHLKVFGHSTA